MDKIIWEFSPRFQVFINPKSCHLYPESGNGYKKDGKRASLFSSFLVIRNVGMYLPRLKILFLRPLTVWRLRPLNLDESGETPIWSPNRRQIMNFSIPGNDPGAYTIKLFTAVIDGFS